MSCSKINQETKKYTFKICLIGDGGVGKTSLVKRHRTGHFEKKYVATLGVEVHPLRFFMKNGEGEKMEVCFNMWDTAGQEKFGGLLDGYYIQSHGAIAMFDVCSKVTYHNVDKWMREFQRVCKVAPICLVGNKVDVEERKVGAKEIQSKLNKLYVKKLMGKGKYFDISAKSNYQFDKPFLHLARTLVGDDSLQFMEAPTMEAPKEGMTKEHIKKLQREAEEAALLPLPFVEDITNKEKKLVEAWRNMREEDILNFLCAYDDIRGCLELE